MDLKVLQSLTKTSPLKSVRVVKGTHIPERKFSTLNTTIKEKHKTVKNQYQLNFKF